MSNESLMRRGAINKLEEELASHERRLKGIIGSLHQVLFYMETPLDCDGESIQQFAKEFRDCQKQGQQIRARIEELKSE